MRGYFGIGVEGISKSMNAGALFRTAHAFRASFMFTVAAHYARAEGGGRIPRILPATYRSTPFPTPIR